MNFLYKIILITFILNIIQAPIAPPASTEQIYKTPRDPEFGDSINSLLEEYYILDYSVNDNGNMCFPTCETCNDNGNERENFCTSCKENYIKSKNNENNCECPKFFIRTSIRSPDSPFDGDEDGGELKNLEGLSDKGPFCVEKCNFIFPFVKQDLFDKGECLFDCENRNDFIYINQCHSKCPNGTIEKKIECNTFENQIKNEYPEEINIIESLEEGERTVEKLARAIKEKRRRNKLLNNRNFNLNNLNNNLRRNSYIIQRNEEEVLNCFVNICEDTYKCARNDFITDYSLEFIKQNLDSIIKTYSNEYVKFSNHVKVIKSIKDDFIIVLYKNEDCFQTIGDEIIKLKLKSLIKETYFIEDDKLDNIIISLIFLFNNRKQIQKIELLLYDENFNKLNDEYFKNNSKIKVTLEIDKNLNLTEELISMISEDNEGCKYNDYINKKDIALNERYNIINKTQSICYEGCTIDKVNNDKVDCYCTIEESSIKTTKKEYVLKELNNVFSFNILKCTKFAFNSDSIFSNNSFIFLMIPTVQLFTSIIYLIFGMKKILNFISCVVSNPPKKDDEEEKKDENKNNEQIQEEEKKNNEISEKNEIDNNEIIKNFSKKSTNSTTKIIDLSSNQSIDTSFDESKRTISRNFYNKTTDSSRTNISQFPLNNNSKILKKEKKINKNNYIESIKNDENILYNKMKYSNAIKYDKRSFCDFYLNQIKERQTIYYTFIKKNNPLDQTSIKIMVFISELSICFLSNGILMNEKYIYNNYNSKNKNIDYFFKNGWLRIFISILIVILFDFLFNLLNIPKKKMIIHIKTKSDKKKLHDKLLEKYNMLKYCNLIFIIINLLIMIFLLIFMITFNYVYSYSSIDLLLGSLITWFFIQILPFLGVLIVSTLRYVGIKSKCKLLFKISYFFTT